MVSMTTAGLDWIRFSQAQKTNGRVIRLVGNHEMMLLAGVLGDDEMLERWFLNLTEEEKQELFPLISDGLSTRDAVVKKLS